MKTTKIGSVEVFPIPAFADNYIWVIQQGSHVAVVDPGDSVPVLEVLEREGFRLAAVLITHHHADHIGGLEKLIRAFPTRPFKIYGPVSENIQTLTDPLMGDEEIRIEGIDLDFQVLSIPGHTRGHLAYYGQHLGPDGSVFCGDTLFGAGCGRLFEGTPAQMQTSLARLTRLPPQTKCYCAHEYTQGNLNFALSIEPHNVEIQDRIESTAFARKQGNSTVPFTIEGELLTNPFLRWDAPEVRAAAASSLGRQPRDAVETFATIRLLKDHFTL